MTELNILYISIEGNTRSFLNRMTSYSEQQHTFNAANPVIKPREITEQTMPKHEDQPFVVFVPTYLDGGNGFDSGFTETLTTPLGEYIAQNDNAALCMGIVGSGNKNFNEQYCLTAREYAAKFDAPFLTDYELRGTDRDIQRVYEVLKKRLAEYQAAQAK